MQTRQPNRRTSLTQPECIVTGSGWLLWLAQLWSAHCCFALAGGGGPGPRVVLWQRPPGHHHPYDLLKWIEAPVDINNSSNACVTVSL